MLRSSRLLDEGTRFAPTDHIANEHCGITEKVRQLSLLKTFKSVSNSTLLLTTGSPQNQAARTILLDETKCPSDNNLLQSYALTVFYFATNGDDWTSCSKSDQNCITTSSYAGSYAFLSTRDECTWAGVECNENKTIKSLSFEQNNLNGALPDEIGILTGLESLNLEHEGITGTIPTTIGKMENLKILNLDFNQLTGTIPLELYNLTKMEQLDLNSNNITGPLSPLVGNLTKLKLLQLNENKLIGTIPPELGTPEDLMFADLFQNDFSGSMPNEVCFSRFPPFGAGKLLTLTADCALNLTSGAIELQCDCCSECFLN